MTNRPELDAYAPAQIAHKVETIGVSKAIRMCFGYSTQDRLSY